jgi:S-adenosylmethionine uptake transporter
MVAIISVKAHRGGRTLRAALATRHPGMHFRRALSGTISLTLWFYAIAGLPLATAMTINYSSPLFIGAWAAFAAWQAGERLDRAMTAALLVGFVGVVLLLQPNFNREQWPYALIGVGSSTLTAVAYLSIKALGKIGEPDTRIVFYFTLFNAATGLTGAALFGFHGHDARGVALLLVIGVSASLAQLAVTRAFAAGGTLLTANLNYTGIVFATLWGYLVFGDTIPLSNALGMGIVVASSVAATWLTARMLRRGRVHPELALATTEERQEMTDAPPR